MMLLGDFPLIDWVLGYTVEAFGKDDTVLVTTTSPTDDELVQHVIRKWNIDVFRGSDLDVRSRFVEVMRRYEFTSISRITADDPFKIPEQLLKGREVVTSGLADYYCNYVPYLFPIGLDVEAFSSTALEKSLVDISDSAIEHVTIGLREDSNLKRFFESGNPQRIDLRLTIDSKEDLAYCNRVVSFLSHTMRPFKSWSELDFILSKMEIEGQ